MRHTVFKFTLWCRHFKMTSVLEFAFDDVINGIGTPVEWVECAASRSTAATPFVSEYDLSAVIIKRG